MRIMLDQCIRTSPSFFSNTRSNPNIGGKTEYIQKVYVHIYINTYSNQTLEDQER